MDDFDSMLDSLVMDDGGEEAGRALPSTTSSESALLPKSTAAATHTGGRHTTAHQVASRERLKPQVNGGPSTAAAPVAKGASPRAASQQRAASTAQNVQSPKEFEAPGPVRVRLVTTDSGVRVTVLSRVTQPRRRQGDASAPRTADNIRRFASADAHSEPPAPLAAITNPIKVRLLTVGGAFVDS